MHRKSATINADSNHFNFLRADRADRFHLMICGYRVDIVFHSALVTVSFLGVVSQGLIPMPNATSNAIGYTKFYSRSHNAMIRVKIKQAT
jgi:hypothetical protein